MTTSFSNPSIEHVAERLTKELEALGKKAKGVMS